MKKTKNKRIIIEIRDDIDTNIAMDLFNRFIQGGIKPYEQGILRHRDYEVGLVSGPVIYSVVQRQKIKGAPSFIVYEEFRSKELNEK